MAARKDMGKGTKPPKETPQEKAAREAAEVFERNAQLRKRTGQPPKLKTMISDRILWALDKIPITGVDAADKAGRSRGHVNNITSGVTKDPEVGVIASLHKHVLSAFSLEWLVTGREPVMSHGHHRQTHSMTAALEKASDTPFIAVAAASAIAGALREERSEGEWSLILAMLGRVVRFARDPSTLPEALAVTLAEYPAVSDAVRDALLAFCETEGPDLSREDWRKIRAVFADAEASALAIADASRGGKERAELGTYSGKAAERRGAPPAEKTSKKSRS